jgi:3-deoxy-D-manno-octulosonate 8-phosphate phosphatase (KDO 8-P phosphatase)
VGDDTPDAPILAAAGIGIAVADAHPDALVAAKLVTTRSGGNGAVREVCDWLMAARKGLA